MSTRAQTAVTYHSQQSKIPLLRLMHYLADVAREDGSIDPAPGQATMAEFLGCTDRSLRNHLSELLESGELIRTRLGSGPGNPSAYQINPVLMAKVERKAEKVEITAEKGGNNEARITELETKVEKITLILSTLQAQMAQMVEILAAKVEKNQPKVETKVEKVERNGGNGSVELSADDPILIPFDPEEREEPPYPPLPKVEKRERPKIEPYRLNPNNPVDARILAIGEVCHLKVDVTARHMTAAENAAVQLRDITADFIRRRYGRDAPRPGEWNWYLHDFRGQAGKSPTPNWIVDTISLPVPIATNGFNGRPENGRLGPTKHEKSRAALAAVAEEMGFDV